MAFDPQPVLVGELLGVRPLRPADFDALYQAPDNLRSQRALEKIGAVRAGTRPDASGNESLLFEVRRP